METGFCVEALEKALTRHGRPDLFNTDQSSQFAGKAFTSQAFTGVLLKAGGAISMDSKGAWRDDVFVKRLWPSIKYEETYLRAYDGVAGARAAISPSTIPQAAFLDRNTPEQASAERGSPNPAALQLSKRLTPFTPTKPPQWICPSMR